MMRAIAVLILISVGASFAAVQVPTQVQVRNQVPATFRSGAYLVYVDAYPRVDGRIVEGLTAPDFRLLEDGKPQTVELFEFVGGGAAYRDKPTAGPVGGGPPLPGRLFILYVNRYFLTMEGARRSPEPLVSFLREVIGPKDLVSWHTPDLPLGALTFGQSIESIEDSLRRYWRQIHDESPYAGTGYGGSAPPVAQSAQEERLTQCYINRTSEFEVNKAIVRELLIRHRIELALRTLEELVGRVSTFGEPRVHVLLVSGAWSLPREGSTKYVWGIEGQSIPDPLRRGSPTRTVDPAGASRSACDADYVRLQTMDAADRFRDLTQRAQRSNLSFVTVDPYGLGAIDPFSSQPLGKGSLDMLRTLAETTGGLSSVGAGDLSKSMRDLSAGFASYYLLGYYSTNTQFNGRYRTIDVKVTQPRVQVSARRGYTAPKK